MAGRIQEVKAKAQDWRERALAWCIGHPLTAWWLTFFLFLNYIFDLLQSIS